MKLELERRYADLTDIEGRTLTGLALPFEVEARVGTMRERFSRGSVVTSGEAVLNVMHDRNRPLAREPETLKFDIREEGLWLSAVLPSTREADDAIEMITKKIWRGVSVEFYSVKERQLSGVRVIDAAVVYGVAIADRATYKTTNLSVRAADLAGIHHQPLPLWVL